MKKKEKIQKFTKDDLPFARPKYDSSYEEVVHYTQRKHFCKMNNEMMPLEEITNRHVCFSQLRQLLNVRHYTNVRVSFHRSILTQLEILKWFNHLNQAYNRELFAVDFNAKVVYIHLPKLRKVHRKSWNQLLNLFGLVRYLYEEGKPMVVRGALYLKDKRPTSDFMHCITAADILTYGRHIANGRHSGHSIFDHGLGTTATFHQFMLRLKKSGWINNAVSDLRDMPKFKYQGRQGVSRGFKMTKNFKCNFDSNVPLTIIKKWHRACKKWDQTVGKKKKKEQEERRKNMYNNNQWNPIF